MSVVSLDETLSEDNPWAGEPQILHFKTKCTHGPFSAFTILVEVVLRLHLEGKVFIVLRGNAILFEYKLQGRILVCLSAGYFSEIFDPEFGHDVEN